MIKNLLILVFILAAYTTASAQNTLKELKVEAPVCYASGKVEKAFIPPPAEFMLKSGASNCDIIVEYSSNFPVEAQTAFEYAVGIWESMLESAVPIHVNVNWSSTLGTNTLASCGPETYYSSFRDAPFEDRFYAVAIAEKISGEELNGVTRSDVYANFNSKINWYYGVDGDTPTDKYDFVSVVLHELAHGLGFTGFLFVEEDLGAYGFYEFGDATSFDIQVEQFSGDKLVDTSFFENASTQLKKVLESNSLYFDSPVAESLDDQRPRLYAPGIFDYGSSVYHLNDATYPAGNKNALMTHAVSMGEAIHSPGPLTTGIMEDIGWTNLLLKHSPVKDKEQVETLVFTVNIDSYYSLAKNSVKVIYSTDNFINNIETLILARTENEGEYSVSLEPDAASKGIQYYVEAADIKGRSRKSPSYAPDDFYSVHFGIDTENPTIYTEPIPYFLLMGEKLQIKAQVDDNLGIDTVYVTYAINGEIQPEFGLSLDFGTNYVGEFPFNYNSLKDGDTISYTIVAVDASNAHNTAIYPESDVLKFRIEQIFDPVTRYFNDFNQQKSDFLISDFEVYTAANFNDGALHSPHPYPSPNVDNKDFEFSTFLKYPIILQADGSIQYDEVVLVEPGESNSQYGDVDFWDYVIVEGSKDLGENWYELTDGYDSGLKTSWETSYNEEIVRQNSQADGSADMFYSHEFSLLPSEYFSAGDTILIRFRLYSDPYATGWGWAIDNLRIQQPTAATITEISPEKVSVYPNPFQNSFEVEIKTGKVINELRIDVFDSFGRNVKSILRNNSADFKEQIDLSDYSSGLYLLYVSENGTPVTTRKLIKNE